MNLRNFRITNFSFFIVLSVAIFFVYRSLFGSYFEADEWFHFTYYLPLSRDSNGLWESIISTFASSGPLSAGQHVVPIASVIYFLNAKLLGLNYIPYAFMSLLLHSVNSFLVFYLVKTFFKNGEQVKKNLLPILSGLFFAFSPAPVHTITGAAPFYGQNILSVTFFLLCIILLKLAFIKKLKKYIFFSIAFLFLSLLTKETSVFLFLLLPILVFMEKRVFQISFLSKIFIISAFAYLILRFVVPNVHSIPNLIGDMAYDYISVAKIQEVKPKIEDTGTIVSQDLSIHKNLPQEILFRSVTFPIKMLGTLFLPREWSFALANIISPIAYPVLPEGDSADSSASRLGFAYGPGSGFIIYLVSIGIILHLLRNIYKSFKQKRLEEARSLIIGFAVIILSALPLVAIIFSFPRWGYDSYFDSRFYYNPNVGASILFPFMVFGLSDFISKHFKNKSISSILFLIIFAIWAINISVVLQNSIRYNTKNYQPDRRLVVEQLKMYLPSLPEKVVFYFETNEKSAYGPVLPFQTSVPQALTLVYYNVSPLPDSFFNKPLFNGNKEGYQFEEGRGFGYYTNKKNLIDDLRQNKFEISDVYAFYYEAEKIKLNNTTSQMRKELEYANIGANQ